MNESNDATSTPTAMQHRKMELFRIIENQFDMGVTLHLHRRGVVPDVEEFGSVDDDRWGALKTRLERRNSWDADYRWSWKKWDQAGTGRLVEVYCIHLEAGVTLFKNDRVEKLQLIWDSRSDSQTVDQVREMIEEIQEAEAEYPVGMIQAVGGELLVRFSSFRPYEQDLVPYMGPEIREFRQQVVSELAGNTAGTGTGTDGLYLLHGAPGTGKTSFLKQVLAEVDRKALFITPSLAGELTSPNFIGLLMDYPDSLLIIEDAETVLMKCSADNSNSVANLLNLTDGFPADFLNLNIICTFNFRLDDIGPALLREGRLRGIQEFGKLDVEYARQLADAAGREMEIIKPMTVAEICNLGINLGKVRSRRAGFR